MKRIKENKKSKTFRFSTDCFNARLFLEGIKRLRVIATAVLILALATAILVPVISWIGRADQYERYIADEIYEGLPLEPAKITHASLCPPLYIVPFLAPLFFFVLFSFLHKRKQSDFFHAIPYTRTCVFVSFSLASLATVSAIAILCAVLSGSIYALCPYTTFSALELLSEIGLSILSAAFLSSFMILSLTLTGTAATSLLLFALFASITRITLGLFSAMVNELTIVSSEFYPFLSPFWFLPFRIFVFESSNTTSNIPSYSHVIPYTAVVTLVIFALAGFVYHRRPSEMAERSAPSRILQAIFRSLFTLPFALLLTALLVTGESEFSLILVLVVITLLAFYLYELITTKRIRNLPRATPWLLAVLGGAVAFFVSFVIFTSAVTAGIPKEKIKSISISDTSMRYETIVSGSFKSHDARAIALVSDAIDFTRFSNAHSHSKPLTYRVVTIHKTNGQTVKRGLYFTEEDNQKLNEYLAENTEYADTYLELPPFYSVERIGFYIDGVAHYNTTHYRKGEPKMKKLYEVLAADYEKLSKADRIRFKTGKIPLSEKPPEDSLPDYIYTDTYASISCVLTMSGTYNGVRYSSDYVIPESMQGLLTYAFSSLSDTYEPAYYESEYQYSSTGTKRIVENRGSHTSLDVSKAIFRDLKSGNLDFDDGYIRIAAYGDLQYSVAVAKNERRFIPFFEAVAVHLENSIEPIAEKLPIIITVDHLYSDTSTDEAHSVSVFFLTKEEYKALLKTLSINQ